MKRNSLSRLMLALLLSLTATLLTIPRGADAMAPGPPPPLDIFAFLPPSDGMLVVNTRRLLSETLPRVFATNAEKLAQINSDIDKFKSKTGIDPRAFDRVVIGARYTYPSPNVIKLEPVAIAQGKFDVKTLAAAGREAAKGGMRQEKYRGATILIFGINDQMKLLGLWDMRVKDLAVCALNGVTLAIGSPANVRAAIDAARTRNRKNVELVALATHDPQAVIGFGANMSRSFMSKMDLGADAITKDINSIRQVYGSIGSTNTDVSLAVVARTETGEAAKNLGETVTGLKQLAGFMIMRITGDKRDLAQSALDNLKITARANELEIRTQFAAAGLASVIK